MYPDAIDVIMSILHVFPRIYPDYCVYFRGNTTDKIENEHVLMLVHMFDIMVIILFVFFLLFIHIGIYIYSKDFSW